MPADLETPVSAYLKLSARATRSFLFESVDQVEKWGRYSFIAADPQSAVWAVGRKVFTQRGRKIEIVESDAPLSVLREEMAHTELPHSSELPAFQGGYVGYLGYDCVRYFEQLPQTLPLRGEQPDFFMMKVERFVVFDNLKQQMMVVVHYPLKNAPHRTVKAKARQALEKLVKRLARPLTTKAQGLVPPTRARAFVPEFDEARYVECVKKAKSYIRSGDVFQVVLSTEFRARGAYDPVSLYRVLRTVNPSPYLYLLNFGDFSVVGSSPEIMFRKEADRAVVRPIAGTRKRGKTPEEDEALKAELQNDIKENAEHVMLIDLGRNDLGRVCEPGTVKVTAERVVERYSHVMHLVSEVEGRLRKEYDWFDLLAATFPAGTLSGAPKIRAMEIIEELEKSRRGIYGGCVGYIGFDGNADMAITIRTLIVKANELLLRAGAGIVQDSVPKLEYEECKNKAKALMTVCERLKSI